MDLLARPLPRGMSVVPAIVIVAALLLTSCRPGPSAFRWDVGDSDWHEFEGTWTATGTRDILHLDGDRRASIATFNGSLVLAGQSKPGIGFRSEAIVFSDSATGMIGRAVWTDEHGDQIFSDLRAESIVHNKITGSFTGGTGRYAGANGSYEFSWKFLLEDENGNVQGQSVGLAGRVRVGRQQAATASGGPHS